MAEYEIKGKSIYGPFIKSENNAVKLLDMMGVPTGVATATFIYRHPALIAKRNLKINPPGFSYDIEFFDDNPFEKICIFEPFQKVEIEIEAARIMDKKKKFGLNEKGYKFAGFAFHQPPYQTGIHILSDKGKKETVASVSEKAGNYETLDKFKLAMEELGFTGLKEKTVKHEIVDLVKALNLKS